MNSRYATKSRPGFWLMAIGLMFITGGCQRTTATGQTSALDPELSSLGTIELTATLLEVPDGAIFERDLYDYATVLKYRVSKVHRGEVKDEVIYVGHYDPWKPRSEAKDKRVPSVGGNLRQFQAGEQHRMALESSIEDVYMGGIVDKYFSDEPHTIYWAVWTNLVRE